MDPEKLTIRSAEHAGRIELFSLVPKLAADGPIRCFHVRLVDVNLDAAAEVDARLAPDFVAFLERIAADWQGWQGSRSWESLEGEFSLECTHDGLGHVRFAARLRSGQDENDWEVQTTVTTDAGLLEQTAAEAKRFFAGRKFDDID